MKTILYGIQCTGTHIYERLLVQMRLFKIYFKCNKICTEPFGGFMCSSGKSTKYEINMKANKYFAFSLILFISVVSPVNKILKRFRTCRHLQLSQLLWIHIQSLICSCMLFVTATDMNDYYRVHCAICGMQNVNVIERDCVMCPLDVSNRHHHSFSTSGV